MRVGVDTMAQRILRTDSFRICVPAFAAAVFMGVVSALFFT